MAGLESLRLPNCTGGGLAAMKTIFKEAIGYAAASTCALALDVTVLWVLVRYCNWWFLAAATASFLSGVVVAYLLSVQFIFTQHRLHDRKAEFVSFAALGGVGLGINAAVIFMAVSFLGLHYIAAKFLAAGITFCCNFVSRRQ